MDDEPHRVVVVDVEMRFFSIVALMVKWAFAAIPALFLIFFFIAVFGWVMNSLFGLGEIYKSRSVQSMSQAKPAEPIQKPARKLTSDR